MTDTALPRADTTTTRESTSGEVPAAGRPALTVVIPAFNEGERLGDSLRQIRDYLTGAGIDYELLVVDDGSTDSTAALLTQLRDGEPRLRVLLHKANHGKGHAVRSGIAAARGRYVMFIDADLTIPIEIAGDMLRALSDGYDMAIASRWHPASAYALPPPFHRRVMGRAFRWLVRALIVSDVRDTQCGCKAYRGDVARDLYGRQRIDHFSFDAEVIFLAARAGYRIKEVPATLRHHDTSSVRPLHDMPVMLRDLVRIRLNAARGRYRRPRQDWLD